MLNLSAIKLNGARGGVTVRTISLDEFATPSLIKMDIEGGEIDGIRVPLASFPKRERRGLSYCMTRKRAYGRFGC